MKKWIIYLLLLLLQQAASYGQQVYKVSDSGAALRRYYQSLDVAHLWIKGHHVNWETGEADNPNARHNTKTHCSVFVAAALKKKNLYVLRPPEHAQTLLANAQFDWLQTPSAEQIGWHEINGSTEMMIYDSAQIYANLGYVVIAVYKNPEPHKSGHAALVMPAELTDDEINQDGPALIMAGHKNSGNILLREGFEKHISQWPETAIRFFRYGG